MEEERILPIGSVVVLKGEKQYKVMIFARYMVTNFWDGPRYYEYGGCFYPEGLVTDKLVNFNFEDIEEVLHEGFIDEDEVKEQNRLRSWFANDKIKRISVEEAMMVKQQMSN